MNPYPKTIIDEASGIEVEGVLWEAFEKGKEQGEIRAFETIVGKIADSPVFLKNCKAQRKKPAKICQDCPFVKLGII